jgi:hypothetical protein
MLMSHRSAPWLGIVRRDDKEAKLGEFIERYLEKIAGGGPPGHCLLIARSAESPVARILLAMGANASLKRLSVRAIFAQLGTAETARIADACRFSDWALQIRWARDLRLLDAHEQLVLAPSTTWIGDCMRREPQSRDACELFAADCVDTTHRASVFFERLWQVCEPIFERKAIEIAEVTPAAIARSIEQPAANSGNEPPRRTSA